jgi:hypothetical protein
MAFGSLSELKMQGKFTLQRNSFAFIITYMRVNILYLQHLLIVIILTSRHYVNRMYEAQAKQLIKEAFSQKEDLSDQELEELAMETHSDEV